MQTSDRSPRPSSTTCTNGMTGPWAIRVTRGRRTAPIVFCGRLPADHPVDGNNGSYSVLSTWKALAVSPFQPWAVENRDSAVRIADKPRFLQLESTLGHAFAASRTPRAPQNETGRQQENERRRVRSSRASPVLSMP